MHFEPAGAHDLALEQQPLEQTGIDSKQVLEGAAHLLLERRVLGVVLDLKHLHLFAVGQRQLERIPLLHHLALPLMNARILGSSNVFNFFVDLHHVYLRRLPFACVLDLSQLRTPFRHSIVDPLQAAHYESRAHILPSALVLHLPE